MTPERWERVKALLHRAMQLAPEKRGPFLDLACADDDAVRAEVHSLLLADENIRSSFLQSVPPSAASDAMPAASSLPPKLGPYEILEPIGRGGMGEVYRARDSRLLRDVAIKILPQDLSGDPARQRRFEREARAASALNHPNIVSIFDFGREGGIPFIVSELIEGESLRQLIARGPVPVRQIFAIAIQLAAGLKAAHAAGIVHRDLKPENIMLTPDGRVKILDFGLAKHIQRHPDGEKRTASLPLTAPGTVMGTVGYLSPEQLRRENVDERSDIFSLGGVLYELAAGKSAFTRGKVMDVISAILLEEPAAITPAIPPVLDGIIRHCLEKDPQRRFQNAAGLEQALQYAERSSMQRAFQPKQLMWWAPAAILAVCGIWFVPRLLPPQRAPASTKQEQSPPAQPAIVPVQPRVAESSVDPAPKKAPAPEPPPAAGPGKIDSPPAPAPAVIETLAGRPWKFTGDGMSALDAALGHCDDMTCDREGNIYVSDWGNQVLLKIDRARIVHVLAGPDSPPGDRPSNPLGLAVDGAGVVYFSQGIVIRKLLPGGHVTPFAGNGQPVFTPDGALARGSPLREVSGIVLAPDGSVIFSEHPANRVRRVGPQGRLRTMAGDGKRGFTGDNGPAQQASLSGPRGLALDSAGNLFIADEGNACVRKVTPDGRITTVAGQGIAGDLGCPTGVAVNRRGDLFVADSCKRQVFLVRDGRMSRYAGNGADHQEPSGDGGPATAASIDVWKLSLDENDNLLISDPDFGHVYRISPDGRIHIVAGSGQWGVARDGTPARQAMFQDPFRVAPDAAGNIFMTDLPANRIYRIDRKGTVSQVAGFAHSGYDGEDTLARNFRLNGPHGIRVSRDGRIVFADCFNNRIREVIDGRLRTLAGNGRRDFSGDGARAVDAALNNPVGVALDQAGNLYIADTGNHRVRKVRPDGRILTVAGNGTGGYSGDGGAAERASLNAPRAVEVDSNGDLYIADMGNHRIRRVSAGVISTLAGDNQPGYFGDEGPAAQARLNLPGDLALSADRQLYIMDRPTRRIRRIDLASGIITTFAGNGETVASGDGGPPTKAGLGDPAGIAVDAAGNVYVTDRESKQLRIIRPASHR